jgi:diguanylate cyclase (GGDEF)-like protein
MPKLASTPSRRLVIARIRHLFRVLFGTGSANHGVREMLIGSLYSQTCCVALAGLCGMLLSLPAVLHGHRPAINAVVLAMAVVTISRVALAWLLPRISGHDTRPLERLFAVGALSYAALTGLLAALAVAYDIPATARTMAVVYAVGYAASASARHAGRPFIAISQLVLTLTPLMVVAAVKPDADTRLLVPAGLLMLAGMFTTTRDIHRVLRDSITSAETSARLAEKMQLLARTDVVTGLLNRAGLNHQLLERSMTLAPDQQLALIWVDLDRFKEVNDTLGHQWGDRLLCEVGARLRKASPAEACVGRFGGDEFIVACEANTRAAVSALAQRLLAEVTRPMRLDDKSLEIACSIGIALLPEDGPDLDSVMQGADLALYDAKLNGRKQVSFFTPAMARALVQRKEIEADLRRALTQGELTVHYQPIHDLATGRLRSFEALVRWFHPEKGEIRPDEFIPIAEETGVIITLGNWITAQAAQAAAHWPEDITLAVNLSPLQIRAPGAALGILSALREARLPAHRLELEVTERVLMEHSANTEAFMAELSEAGVRFALDDFGTGYSSLSYLARYPFGKIKVDRSFVSGEGAGIKHAAIIRAVSSMGAALGMEIVAEGLETADQVRAVREAGCTLGQGYHYSKAVPEAGATALIARDRALGPLLRLTA